jgi:hypothetical protein
MGKKPEKGTRKGNCEILGLGLGLVRVRVVRAENKGSDRSFLLVILADDQRMFGEKEMRERGRVRNDAVREKGKEREAERVSL